jgi:hypothetical protein
MRKALPFVALLLATLAADPSAAQETARVGVVAGYPVSIGVLWRASASVAIRPEFNVQWTDSTSVGSRTTTITGITTTGLGASALFYLAGPQKLRPYLSARFLYSPSSRTFEMTPPEGGVDQTSRQYSLAGCLGAEYGIARRLAVFGEVGVGYAYLSDEIRPKTAAGVAMTAGVNSLETRTAVGVIFFF